MQGFGRAAQEGEEGVYSFQGGGEGAGRSVVCDADGDAAGGEGWLRGAGEEDQGVFVGGGGEEVA